MVVFGQKWLLSGRSGCIPANWLYFGQRYCFSGKVVVFGQKWLLSGKSGCIRDKSGCIRAN